ncbi:MAG: hypothetical protein AAGE84_11530 [Cyanobacteria bacterium P01_G01_bin.39]
MLIRNLNFFEQVDSANDVQGGAAAGTFAGTFAFTGSGLSVGDADADAAALGNFNTFAKTDTTATAQPFSASGAAGAAASGVDSNGSIAASVDGSVSSAFGF